MVWERASPPGRPGGLAGGIGEAGRLAPASQNPADDPGPELLLADAGPLALGLLPGGDRDDLLEDLAADDGKRRPLQDDAAVDVHVLFHVTVHERVGGQLDGGHRLAAEHRAA